MKKSTRLPLSADMAEKGNSPERHQKLYTKRKPFNSQMMRRQLRENKVQLRKKERSKLLFKKRLGTREKVALPPTVQSSLVEDQMIGMLTSLSSNVITLPSIREVHRLLSSTDEYNATISQVIQAGIVPRLVGCLGEGNEPDVQCEILNVLGRIVTGTTAHTHAVVECGAVPVLIHLLDSSSDLVTENALQALANIAADCDDCTVCILDTGILQPLLRLLPSSTEASLIAIRGVACLRECVGHLSDISGVLSVLYHLLEQEDEKVLKAVCSTLNDYFIAYGVSIERGACQRLVNLVEHISVDVSYHALCAVLEVLTSGSHISMMLNCSLLSLLVRLFQQEWLHEEICSAIYRIIASARDHLQTVIDHDAGIFQLLFTILSSSMFEVKRKALSVVHSAIKTGSSEQVRAIVSSDHWHVIVGLGCIKALCQQLRVHDPSTIDMLLDIFNKILSVGKMDAGGGPNVNAEQVEEHNGLEIIEGLQFHENKTIRESATQIIDKYFESDT